jgi:hypothetical protein
MREGGFADLPRPKQGDRRVGLNRLKKVGLDVPPDNHPCIHGLLSPIYKVINLTAPLLRVTKSGDANMCPISLSIIFAALLKHISVSRRR